MSLKPMAAGLFLTAILAPCLATSQTFTYVNTLYQFTGQGDGSNPIGGVIEDSVGTIYGETNTGGTIACSSSQDPFNKGCGTVYSFTPAGGLRVLATLAGPNGAHGNIAPILSGKRLYGATQQGGANDDGVVFSLNTDGSNYTLLHQFDGADGSAPDGSLATGPGGVLYGITNLGGANNVGVLYSLTPSGVYSVLHSFGLPVSGNPNTLLIAANGELVGSTATGGGKSNACFSGCGTIFTYLPATGKFTTVYTLPNSAAAGVTPFVGSIGPGPTIFAADQQQVFSLSQKTGFVPIASFDYYSVGSGIASGPLYTPGGTLYGVLGGGQSIIGGGLYSVQGGKVVDTAYLHTATGAAPEAKPFLTPGGSLIGTTALQGLCTSCGAIWRYTP